MRRRIPRFHAWAERDFARNGLYKWNGAAFTIGFFWKPILDGYVEGDRLRAKFGTELLVRLPALQWWEDRLQYVGLMNAYRSERWTGRVARKYRITLPRLSLWSFR